MGGCTNCGSKAGCDDRKGSMMESVETALARLYPTRTWGIRDDRALGHAAGAAADAASLGEELAGELDAAVIARAGGPEESCDFLYVLCVGRPPCGVQIRDAGVIPPAEWRGAHLQEQYLRIALSTVSRMAAVQEVAIDITDADTGYVIRERPRAGVYSAPLLRRFQRLVAILPAYDILHVDMGEIAGPPPGFSPGAWPEMFVGAPAIANYLFYPQPTTMVTSTWIPS